jgi:hypothetical protein
LKDFKNREVNLLPSDFHKGAKIRFGLMIVIAMFVIAVGAFGYYEFSVYQDTQNLKDEIVAKQSKINMNQRTINNQKIIVTLDQRIATKEFLLEYIFAANKSIVDMLDLFEYSLNGEVYLTSLTADSTQSLTVSASSLSHEGISHLINQLKLITDTEGNKFFDDVTTKGIVRNVDEDGNVTYLFQLECQFGGGLYEVK